MASKLAQRKWLKCKKKRRKKKEKESIPASERMREPIKQRSENDGNS